MYELVEMCETCEPYCGVPSVYESGAKPSFYDTGASEQKGITFFFGLINFNRRKKETSETTTVCPVLGDGVKFMLLSCCSEG